MRHKSAETSCVRYRDRTPPRVRRQSLGHPREWDRRDEKEDEPVASLLFSISR